MLFRQQIRCNAIQKLVRMRLFGMLIPNWSNNLSLCGQNFKILELFYDPNRMIQWPCHTTLSKVEDDVKHRTIHRPIQSTYNSHIERTDHFLN